MAKIKTFELDRWSEPDEQWRVRHLGMADARETFDKLEAHLEDRGLLPDEYFLFNDELRGELPEFDEALCIPNFGASEGIYLDISLACRDSDGKQKFIHFATGKTLAETGDAFVQMHLVAAECSLMLNGRGCEYVRNNVELTLTADEADAVANELELTVIESPPHPQEALLSSALEKFERSLNEYQTLENTEEMTLGGM